MSKWTYSPDPSGNALFDEEGRWIGEPISDEVGHLMTAAPDLLAVCEAADEAIRTVVSANCSPAAFRRHVLPILGELQAAIWAARGEG